MVSTHTHRYKISTLVFMWLKYSKREIIHDPGQYGHLREYINTKEK